MVKKLVGVYDTEAEVMEVVGRLEEAGYSPHDITLVAKNDTDSLWLRNEGVNTTTTNDLSRSEQADDESFWDKVKNVFSMESSSYNDDDGFTSRFSQYGFSNDDAERYNRAVQRGQIVVLAPESYSGALNATTGVEGTDYDTDTDYNLDLDRNPEHRMKLREEELDIDKRDVSAGEVEIRKEVHEDIERVDIPVTREELYIDRKPANERETMDTNAKMEDETFHVPLKEEEIEVRKRPVVREEVEIGKKKVQDTKEVSDTVKHEELDVDMNNRDKHLEMDDEPRKEKSAFAREYDVAFLKEDEAEDGKERRAKRKWDIDNNRDRL